MHVRATLSPFEPTRRGSKTRVRKFFFGKGTRVGASACRSGGMHRGISKKVRRSAVGISVFENWNRYYDPFTGRYIQPEPLLQSPLFSKWLSRAGYSPPTYGYAFNSPQRFTDRSGLQPDLDDLPDFDDVFPPLPDDRAPYPIPSYPPATPINPDRPPAPPNYTPTSPAPDHPTDQVPPKTPWTPAPIPTQFPPLPPAPKQVCAPQ